MKRAYVYKLRPTPEQEAVLLETLETCRRLYNRALAERKYAWEHELVPKKLYVRWHSCPYCGLKLHRDVNAAVNVEERAWATPSGSLPH